MVKRNENLKKNSGLRFVKSYHQLYDFNLNCKSMVNRISQKLMIERNSKWNGTQIRKEKTKYKII